VNLPLLHHRGFISPLIRNLKQPSVGIKCVQLSQGQVTEVTTQLNLWVGNFIAQLFSQLSESRYLLLILASDRGNDVRIVIIKHTHGCIGSCLRCLPVCVRYVCGIWFVCVTSTKISIALSDRGPSETSDRHVYPRPWIDPNWIEQ
jgi:hypothetical protein